MPKIATTLDGTIGHCWSPFTGNSIADPLAKNSNVFIKSTYIPIVKNDNFGQHSVTCTILANHSGKVSQASDTIFINGKAVARDTDALDCKDRIKVLASVGSNVYCDGEGGGIGGRNYTVYKMYIYPRQTDSTYTNYVTANEFRAIFKLENANSNWQQVGVVSYESSLVPPQTDPRYATTGPQQIHELIVTTISNDARTPQLLSEFLPLTYSYISGQYPIYRIAVNRVFNGQATGIFSTDDRTSHIIQKVEGLA